MSSSTRRVNLVASVVLVISLVGGIVTLSAIDRVNVSTLAQQALFIQSSRVLRRMSLGYTGLLADI